MNRKSLVLLLISLVLVASGLFATDSRMTALGYPYGFIRDDTDIHTFPSTIFRYNRSVTGEIFTAGNSWDWTIGTNVPLKANVLGFYLNLPTDVDLDGHINWPNFDLDLSRKVQFYYGFKDKFALGFGMAIDSQKYTREIDATNTDYTEEMSAQYFEISGGMSVEKMDLGAKIYLRGAAAGDDNDNALIDESSHSGLGLKLGGRYFIQENNNLDLVALANLGFESLGDKVERGGASNREDKASHFRLEFGLGLGGDYKIAPNHHIVLAVKPIQIISTNTTLTNSENDDEFMEGLSFVILPEYTLGVESQITKWLTGRVGANQRYVFWTYSEEDDYEAGNNDESEATAAQNSIFDMNLGLAFNFGKFTIDTVLSKSLLHDGPDFLGGQTAGLATQASVKFEF
ncbi:MAG TPA: hypothetical protein PK802_05570 [Candidatus Cloacimonadota bacterium]|jgi:hypothetical protein|nr:hypothetical protein [Candidatus Cloacimonadota bacterium]HOF59817.1 hypothetical protein [Candidatus Cloacimonadota bacterium]HOR58678.1 hypothetical protein [Candidatus Cloacimonadota bacterium]HPB09139.1 hypothetical protein [Candidatus Cloacimonadota bacterium]HQL13443.1 hypothetical protein [Candidatus Cloacimonadota bacterium]